MGTRVPANWLGDTYDQFKAGQAFDIANPLHKLFELNTSNNISLRKIILGGKRGHRTVRVPAWHGIDPKG